MIVPDSEPNPRANGLWDEIPEGCEVRRCVACGLNFMSGPGQVPHWPHCPEGEAKVTQFVGFRIPDGGVSPKAGA